MDIPEPLILYDNDCGLCHAAVRLVRRHDRQHRFHYATLDSPLASEVRRRWGIPASVDSIILVDGHEATVRSEAVFQIVRRLGRAWHLLRIGELLPRRAADGLYDAVAGRRGSIAKRMGWRCDL